MEPCASAHHWARELAALGHEVKLMPPQYEKPYVKRGKNDAADAEAICEAVTRPTMRFVGVKSPDQQATMMLHRVCKILNRQRTQLSNALRAHIAEFGIVAAIGRGGLDRLAYGEKDICRLAAAYAFGIARNHPFTDGNKRTAWVLARLFLSLNHTRITFRPEEAIEMVLALASGALNEAEIANWFSDGLA
jgi:death-on-curing family protein